jgi:hypothetical protein
MVPSPSEMFFNEDNRKSLSNSSRNESSIGTTTMTIEEWRLDINSS